MFDSKLQLQRFIHKFYLCHTPAYVHPLFRTHKFNPKG